MFKVSYFALPILAIFAISLDFVAANGGVTDPMWNAYKAKYEKTYPTASAEAYARYYYAYNKRLIDNHNVYYNRGLRTFRLEENQFSDIRLVTFNALFPVAIEPQPQSNPVAIPPVSANPPNSFEPSFDLGFNFTVEDQGTVCNSGWAYATAKAIEMLKAYKMGDYMPASLSGQNLIDCAGRSGGCTNQVPLTAFEYFTVYNQELYTNTSYPPNKTQAEQGMCIRPPLNTPGATTLNSYARIPDGQDDVLKRTVPTYPVVIEFNPTSFEFMHYKEGIFQQPATYRGSHFMTVVGFGRNETTNLDYFILQNSFNTTWGENGRIKIAYSTARKLTKSAILPVDL